MTRHADNPRTERLIVRMDAALSAALDAHAAAAGETRSAYVRRLLAEGMDRQDLQLRMAQRRQAADELARRLNVRLPK